MTREETFSQYPVTQSSMVAVLDLADMGPNNEPSVTFLRALRQALATLFNRALDAVHVYVRRFGVDASATAEQTLLEVKSVAVDIEYTVASTSDEEAEKAQFMNEKLAKNKEMLSEELVKEGIATCRIQALVPNKKDNKIFVEKRENSTKLTEMDRLRKMIKSLKTQLYVSKNATAKCKENCGNEIEHEKRNITNSLEENVGATGGKEETAAQIRSNSLTSIVNLLRESRALDVTVLTWVNSENRTNTTGKIVLDGMNDVSMRHREAKVARLIYVHVLRKHANRTRLLKQLDEEALEMVPEYGSKLVEKPLSSNKCNAIYDLSKQCPGHFGCSRKENKCVSCSDSSSCVMRQKEFF